MSEFRDRPPLSARLRGEFEKIRESGSELAEKVDKLVVEIKKTSNKNERQKMMEELLIHIHPLLEREVYSFYQKFSRLLSKHGFTEEDIYNRAVEEMMNFVDKWEDRETRKVKGETPAHFTSYFLDRRSLGSVLQNIFLRPFSYRKRMGEEVSLNQPAPGYEAGGSLQSALPDQKIEDPLSFAIKNQEIKMGRDVVLNKLYSDKDPFLSLMAILRFGLEKNVLNEWKDKFDLSVKSGKIRKDYRKYIPHVEGVMEKYNGEEMMYQEIGDLLGVVKSNIRTRLETAFKNLKEKL